MTMDVQDCCLVRVNQMTCPYKYWIVIELVEVVDIVVDIAEGSVDIAEDIAKVAKVLSLVQCSN